MNILAAVTLLGALALVHGDDNNIFSKSTAKVGDTITLTCDLRRSGSNAGKERYVGNLSVSKIDKANNEETLLVMYHDTPHTMGGFKTVKNRLRPDMFSVETTGLWPTTKFDSSDNWDKMRVTIVFRSLTTAHSGTYRCEAYTFENNSENPNYIKTINDEVLTVTN